MKIVRIGVMSHTYEITPLKEEANQRAWLSEVAQDLPQEVSHISHTDTWRLSDKAMTRFLSIWSEDL